MHATAYGFVANWVMTVSRRKRVLEIGSFDVNGSVRPLFEGTEVYVGIDRREGRGVDVVADGAAYKAEPGGKLFDTVITTSTVEHADNLPAVLKNAYDLLEDRGWIVITTHGEGYAPHDVDGGGLKEGGFYQACPSDFLKKALGRAGFARIVTETNEVADSFAVARKWEKS